MGTSKSAKSTAAKASLALKLARSLVKKIEVKNRTFTISQAATITPAVILLNGVADGSEEDERQGLEISGLDFHLRYHMVWNALDTTKRDHIIRIVYVRDKQQVADTSPTAAQIFGTALVNIQDLFHHETVPSRFEIISDKLFHIGNFFTDYTDTAGISASASDTTVFGEIKKKFNHKVYFNGILSSDIQKNGLYMVILSTSGVNGPEVFVEGRFSYTD